MAQLKLIEIWKALNIDSYPFKPEAVNRNDSVAHTRACTAGKLIETANSNLSKASFRHDAIHLWNSAPAYVISAKTLYSAKTNIKKFVKSFPI